jgi:hypothetical protein
MMRDERDDVDGLDPDFGPGMDRVTALLNELKEADPAPSGLVREVMETIESKRRRGVGLRPGETRMAKKVLIGLATAAAAVIVVFATVGWPPAGSGTEGTIGAAKRHQAQQLTAADVKLGDPAVQEFLQSDLGARLMKDSQARSLLGNAGVREVLANAQLRELLSVASVREVLARSELREALEDAKVQEALLNRQLRELLTNSQLREALSKSAVREVLANAQARQVLELSGAQGLPKVMELASQVAPLQIALQDQAFRSVVVSGLMARALQNTMLSSPAGLRAIGQSIESGALRSVTENAVLAQALEAGVLAQALGNARIRSAIEGGMLAQALANNALNQAIGNQGFQQALSSQALAQALSADAVGR